MNKHKYVDHLEISSKKLYVDQFGMEGVYTKSPLIKLPINTLKLPRGSLKTLFAMWHSNKMEKSNHRFSFKSVDPLFYIVRSIFKTKTSHRPHLRAVRTYYSIRLFSLFFHLFLSFLFPITIKIELIFIEKNTPTNRHQTR